MQNPLISIIIPTYNSEKYIDRCIKSVLNQSYNNIEIIVIDDGSKDKTPDILKNLKHKYSNKMTVITQNNNGSGYARNVGIKNCNGDFFTFVDSDDALKANAIADFFDIIDEKTDIIIAGFESINNRKNSKKTIHYLPVHKSLWTELKFPCTAFKLYRTEYIKNNKIYFTNTKLLEDVTFNIEAFSKTKNIKVLSKCNYINYLNNDSLTANLSQFKVTDISKALNTLLENKNISKYPKNMFMFFCIRTAVQNILMQMSYAKPKDLNDLFSKYWDIIAKHYEIKIYWQKKESKLINVIVNVFIISKRSHTLRTLIKSLKLMRINI